jgi:hypothetical protein
MNSEQSMKKLATYHFVSQGGPLENCGDYQKFCAHAVYLESLLAEALPLLRLEFNPNGPQRLLADRIATATKNSSEEPNWSKCPACGYDRHSSGVCPPLKARGDVSAFDQSSPPIDWPHERSRDE